MHELRMINCVSSRTLGLVLCSLSKENHFTVQIPTCGFPGSYTLVFYSNGVFFLDNEQRSKPRVSLSGGYDTQCLYPFKHVPQSSCPYVNVCLYRIQNSVYKSFQKYKFKEGLINPWKTIKRLKTNRKWLNLKTTKKKPHQVNYRFSFKFVTRVFIKKKIRH